MINLTLQSAECGVGHQHETSSHSSQAEVECDGVQPDNTLNLLVPMWEHTAGGEFGVDNVRRARPRNPQPSGRLPSPVLQFPIYRKDEHPFTTLYIRNQLCWLAGLGPHWLSHNEKSLDGGVYDAIPSRGYERIDSEADRRNEAKTIGT